MTVRLDGEDVPCGRIYTAVRRGHQSASFVYDRTYLGRADAFELSPDLPLGEATIHSSSGPLFRAFEDCMPDRWGRNLMLRAERGAEGRGADSDSARRVARRATGNRALGSRELLTM